MDCKVHPVMSMSGRGRMAAMERFLLSNNGMDQLSDMSAHERMATQFIQNELREADETNLLDEEDMHVFDRKPVQDPLQLVMCNTCRKPIKASQYAGHVERCKSLNSSEDSCIEFEGGAGTKRQNRKPRKLVQTVHDTVNLRDKGVLDSLDADDSNSSELANFDDGLTGFVSSSCREFKKNMSSGDEISVIDGSRSGTGSASFAEIPISPAKRVKLVAAQSPLTTEDTENTCGVGTESGPCHAALSCPWQSDSLNCTGKGQSQHVNKKLEEDISRESQLNLQTEQKNTERCLTEIPQPLATKIHYPRKNLHLRAVIGRLFKETLSKETSTEQCLLNKPASEYGIQSSTVHGLLPEHDTSEFQKEFVNHKKHSSSLSMCGRFDKCSKKYHDALFSRRHHFQRETSTATSKSISEQMIPATSEAIQTVAGSMQPHLKFPNQYTDNRISVPHSAMEPGLAVSMRNRFLQAHYVFPPTGSSVGSMQQASGIVPVI